MAAQIRDRGGRVCALFGRQRSPPSLHNQAGMALSIVNLPAEVREPYEVYVNGVPQQEGVDFKVKGRTLMFARELRKDRISKRRWLLGAWGVGTYKQDDSVDVRYEAPDGSPRVAEALEIEAG